MRRPVAWLLMVCALSACSPAAPGGDPSGLMVVTAGGTALVNGADDVPPTLDLVVAGGGGPSTQGTTVRLDGAEIALRSSGDGVAARVGALELGSAHTLELSSGRSSQRIAFHVVAPSGVTAAVRLAGSGPAVDVTFERAPDRSVLEKELAGAGTHWSDERHVTLTWSGSAPPAIQLPAAIPTARGSHLAGDLRLNLAVPQSSLRRVTVPPAPAPGRLQVAGFTVATAASQSSVAAHAQDLSVVIPAGWHVSPAGELTGAPDQTAVAAATAAQVPLWPLVQNDATESGAISALLNDPAAEGRLITQIADGVARGGFVGIHLDLEGIPAADRDRVTHLVHDLATALHQRKGRLAVDVIPHREGHLNRYSAAYDTTAIGRDADLVALLGYDQHTAASDPGPVAGLDWQAQVLGGTLPGLDPAKTLLGVPLYARTWDGGSSTAAPYQDAVGSALSNQSAVVDYDFAAATPFIHWQPPGGSMSAVYFDDADSLARKLALAKHRGMAGVAAWRLGFEDPAFWGLAQLSERG